MKRHTLFLLLLVSTINLIACKERVQHDDKTISASITPIEFLIDYISGNEYNINVIVPPGVSPETFDPLPSQMKKLSKSKLYFQIGLIDFERSITEKIQGTPGNKIINLSDGLELIENSPLSESHTHHHTIDPHIWLSPSRTKQIAKAIKAELTLLNPANKDLYSSNLSSLTESLDSVDSYIRHTINNIAATNKVILMHHPFLGYFAKDYGIELIAIEKDGKEPSLQHLKEITSKIKELGINTIFYQPQSDNNSIEAIAKMLNLTPVEIDPLAYDMIDNMIDIANKLKTSMCDE